MVNTLIHDTLQFADWHVTTLDLGKALDCYSSTQLVLSGSIELACWSTPAPAIISPRYQPRDREDLNLKMPPVL